MATLADTIKKNGQVIKRGSQLFETAPESLSQQVNRQNMLPGSAVSPEMAAGLGATEDQAKMAGSAAQIQNAIRESVSPAQRRKEPAFRQIETQGEKEAKERAAQMSWIGNFGTRIGGMINSYVKDASSNITNTYTTQPTTPPPAGFQWASRDKVNADGTKTVEWYAKAIAQFKEADFKKAYPNLTPEQVTKVKNAIENGVVDAELYSIFPTAQNDANLLTTELQKYTQPASTSVTSAITAALNPDVPLSALTPDDFKALGITGLGDIATTLGETEDNLRKMTVSELQRRIDTLTKRDYAQVADLQRIAGDASYPENIRQEAQRQLRELSASGLQATEADVNRLNASIQSANVIRVGDKDMTVAEMLADDGISSIIDSYLTDEDGDYKKLIQDQFPELVKYIEANRTALEDAAKSLSDEAKKVADVQKGNAALAKFNSVDMTEVNKLLFPGYDPTKPSNTDWAAQAKNTPVYSVLSADNKEFTDEDKLEYAIFLNKMATLNPTLLTDYFKLNANDLRAKMPAGMSPAVYFKRELDRQKNIALSAATNTSVSDQKAVYDLFGGESLFNLYSSSIKDLGLLTGLGLGTVPDSIKPIVGLLDANGDGKVDDFKSVRERINKYLNDTTTGYKLEDGLFADLPKKIGDNIASETYNTLWQKVKDGNLTVAEANEIIGTNDDKQIAKLYDLLTSKDITIENVEGIKGTLNQRTSNIENSLLKEANVTPGYYSNLPDIVNNPGRLGAFIYANTGGYGAPLNSRLNNTRTFSKQIYQDMQKISAIINDAKYRSVRPALQKMLDNLNVLRSESDKEITRIESEITQKQQQEAITSRAVPKGRGATAYETPRYSYKPSFPLPAGWIWAEEIIGRTRQYYAKRK